MHPAPVLPTTADHRVGALRDLHVDDGVQFQLVATGTPLPSGAAPLP